MVRRCHEGDKFIRRAPDCNPGRLFASFAPSAPFCVCVYVCLRLLTRPAEPSNADDDDNADRQKELIETSYCGSFCQTTTTTRTMTTSTKLLQSCSLALFLSLSLYIPPEASVVMGLERVHLSSLRAALVMQRPTEAASCYRFPARPAS